MLEGFQWVPQGTPGCGYPRMGGLLSLGFRQEEGMGLVLASPSWPSLPQVRDLESSFTDFS